MPSLDTKIISELYHIWEDKSWKFTTKEEEAKTFDLLCEMISLLPSITQKLVLNMMREYTRYSFNDYISLMILGLSKITDDDIHDIEKLIFAPLNSEYDDKRGTAKSGTVLPYLAAYNACPSIDKLQDLRCYPLAAINAIPTVLDDKNALIILLDDFIGTGSTADNAIKYCKTHLRDNDRLIVLSLVTMEEAVSYVENKHNLPILYGDIVKKGIADNTFIINKADAYALIDSIEADLNIVHNYRRGFMTSEALVTMIRTPDNTFPMYWCINKIDGSSWPAPFPR